MIYYDGGGGRWFWVRVIHHRADGSRHLGKRVEVPADSHLEAAKQICGHVTTMQRRGAQLACNVWSISQHPDPTNFYRRP